MIGRIVRRVVAGLVLIVAMVCFVMGATQKTYWQDLLLTPKQAWVELYGINPDSQLAYNVWIQKQLLDGQGKVIEGLKKEIEALKDKEVIQ